MVLAALVYIEVQIHGLVNHELKITQQVIQVRDAELGVPSMSFPFKLIRPISQFTMFLANGACFLFLQNGPEILRSHYLMHKRGSFCVNREMVSESRLHISGAAYIGA